MQDKFLKQQQPNGKI